jgi:hypothetical protein
MVYPEAAEIEVGGFFAAASGELMRRNVFRGKRFAGKPVKRANDGVDDAPGHAG